MVEDKLYFAYGSNINLDQMAYRCPAAQVVGPVVLEGYELLFRGNASGNGVATIKPKEGQQVHGLLWRITPGCERSLDLYEGYPHLYEKESVAVRDNAGRQLTVMAYGTDERPVPNRPGGNLHHHGCIRHDCHVTHHTAGRTHYRH